MKNLTMSQYTVEAPVEKKFSINVERTCARNYEVTATSKREAQKKAVALAMQDDWSREEPVYETYDLII